MDISAITTFFAGNARADNDATNKIRESKVLVLLHDPPAEYLTDAEHGAHWRQAHQEWLTVLRTLHTKANIPLSTRMEVKLKAGRGFNYDADLLCFQGDTLTATKKLEFKFGGTSIAKLPQILSLQAKALPFTQTYDRFYYTRFLDMYLATDASLTVAKPDLDTYLKLVTSTNYDVHPFFRQLKDNEATAKRQKDAVVNESIAAYLQEFGPTLDVKFLEDKVLSTQDGKFFTLWHNGKFYLDFVSPDEMRPLTLTGVKTGKRTSNANTLLVQAPKATYKLLLRWRNHKGILNPAWQIAIERQSCSA